jgi:hypothetical protein
MRDLVFVACARGAKEDTLLYRSLQNLQIGDFHFFEQNRRGLPDCYNEWLDRLAGTDRILVLAHADVSITDAFVREKLNEAIRQFQIVGLAGSAHFDPRAPVPCYAWGVWPAQYLSGAVEQSLGNNQSAWFVLGPTPRRCVVLDGLLLAVDVRKIGSVRFDPRFDFHHYDLDFCLTAHTHGLTLGTTNVHAYHASLGDFTSAEYRRSMQTFRAKWGVS